MKGGAFYIAHVDIYVKYM